MGEIKLPELTINIAGIGQQNSLNSIAIYIAKLLSYWWSGNVKELENILLPAIITSPKGTLELDKSFPPQYCDGASAVFLNFHDMERAHIQLVLKKTQ